ncbi:YdbC family protein [Lysinibacillus sphaericus]
MIIKKITCKVKPSKKEAFFENQMQWKSLREVNGFLGQLGGWSAAYPLTACIFSFWDTQRDYEYFMEEIHDGIVVRSGQGDSYESIEVNLFEEKFAITEKAEDISVIIEKANYIRTALSCVKEDAVQHFEDMQVTIWNPGMEKFTGMLGGTFAISQKQRNLFLSVTGWEDEAEHQKYVEKDFTELRNKAGTSQDALKITGEHFKVEEAWRVCANR